MAVTQAMAIVTPPEREGGDKNEERCGIRPAAAAVVTAVSVWEKKRG